MWPSPTPPEVFARRRARLAERFSGPLLLPSGFARVRNFPGNRFPFRAESHFCYLVGPGPEGAALFMEGDRAVLYAHPPDPDDALWVGPVPSLSELSERLGIEVEPLDALMAGLDAATLPPQDADTALWISSVLERDVEPGGGDELEGRDAVLADALIALRLAHDAAGVEQIRQAVGVTARALSAGMASTTQGMREAVVRGAMEGIIVAHGMVPAYHPIVTRRGEILHAERSTELLRDGDLLLADVGAESPNGWASDVTRTWPVSGRFSSSQKAMYEVVLAAQKAAIAAVGPGRRFLDVHRVAGRALLEGLVGLGVLKGDVDDLYELGAGAVYFPHGIGHLLGLDVHDLEDLGDRAGYAPGRARPEAPGDRLLRLDRDLMSQMVVTIEPGFYRIPALEQAARQGPLGDHIVRSELSRYDDVRGIRIEDDVLVTDTGREVLSREIPKSVDEVTAAMAG